MMKENYAVFIKPLDYSDGAIRSHNVSYIPSTQGGNSVYLPHDTYYAIGVSNNTSVPSHCDIYVDGTCIGNFYIPKMKVTFFERPVFTKKRFLFVSKQSTLATEAGLAATKGLGVIEILLYPGLHHETLQTVWATAAHSRVQPPSSEECHPLGLLQTDGSWSRQSKAPGLSVVTDSPSLSKNSNSCASCLSPSVGPNGLLTGPPAATPPPSEDIPDSHTAGVTLLGLKKSDQVYESAPFLTRSGILHKFKIHLTVGRFLDNKNPFFHYKCPKQYYVRLSSDV